MKSLCCAANKLLSISALLQYKTLYFMPIACQCVLANCEANTHRLVLCAYALHTIMPTGLCFTYQKCTSVRPHQVSHLVTTFDALPKNYLYRFLQRCASSSNVFIGSLQMSDAFYKSLFFLNCLTLLHDGDQLI